MAYFRNLFLALIGVELWEKTGCEPDEEADLPLDITLEQVRQFHEAFGHPVNEDVYINDDALNKLRVELIQEELDELSDALDEGNVVEVLDALCDLNFVIKGAFLALGYSCYHDAANTEVFNSNMSKADENGDPIYREDGKILKGPNYFKPDFTAILRKDA